MSRFKLLFVVSLLVLGVLIVLTVFRPFTSNGEFSTVSREAIIQRDDEWIVQFTITNREGQDMNFVIDWSSGGEVYTHNMVPVRAGSTVAYIHHIYPPNVRDGKVELVIHRESETTPLEQSTYYIKFK